MSRFGFCGPSYTSQSRNVDAEMCLNLYPENVEGQGKSQIALYPTPGLKLFCTLVTSDGLPPSSRGQCAVNGRSFAVCGTNFYEILSGGTFNLISSALLNDSKQVSIAVGLTQILIASAGTLYVFNFVGNTFSTVAPLILPVAQVAFVDGFFIALLQNSNQIQVSKLLDATSWDPGQTAKVSVFPDNILDITVLHREIWMLGVHASTVYFDSGNLFPFDVNPSAGVIEMGITAPLSTTKLDNSIFWIGSDERGGGVVWRASGYTPVRVSNHAVEFAMQMYSRIDDAVGYGYQDQGHAFLVLYFPTANKTWVFDVSTGMWHERAFWDSAHATFTAHRSQNHVFNFGKHLVGDWSTGNIYQMQIPTALGTAWDFVTDFGNPIRRLRRAPHIASENEYIFHQELMVDIETGLGPQPPLLDGNGNPRDPVISLRWSDDGGHTWSNYYDVGAGQAGNYKTRAVWRRLGRSRARVYEISMSDPIPWRIVDAYLRAFPGFQPQERLAAQYRKVS